MEQRQSSASYSDTIPGTKIKTESISNVALSEQEFTPTPLTDEFEQFLQDNVPAYGVSAEDSHTILNAYKQIASYMKNDIIFMVRQGLADVRTLREYGLDHFFR